VLVLIYVGGNDMQKYLTQADAAAAAGLRGDLPSIAEDWRTVFAYFNESANFPDGATIIMNNQYNPFDDCTASPYNLSAAKSELLGEFNVMLAGLADELDNVTITDQYTSYLGHGHHYNVASCPHYQPGLEPFMNDLIHPNAAGHANLAAQWTLVADELYGNCQ
jgi:lysophospholipase L1-like esterase